MKTIDVIDEPQKVLFGYQDKNIIIQADNKIVILDQPLWEQKHEIESETLNPMFCVSGEDKGIIAVFHGDTCFLHDLKIGKSIGNVKHSKKIMFNGRNGHGVMYGSKNYVVVTDTTSQHITVLNLRLNSFGPKQRAFKDTNNGVDGLVITKDEQCLIIANCLDNDLHFKDINTLTTTRTVKGVPSDLSMDYGLTIDGQFLYFPSNCQLVVWNLNTCERSVAFEYTESLTCVKAVDLNTIITLSDDCVIRKWDLTKSNNNKNVRTKQKILRIELLPNSRYVLCHCVFKDEKMDNVSEHCFQVYDLLEKDVVRQATFVGNPPLVHHIVDDMTVAIVTKTDHKLKLVDMDTMTIKMVFEGKTHIFSDFVVLKQGKEIAILTKHRKNVKIFETNKPRAKVVLKGRQQERIRYLQANSKSTVLLAITDNSKSYLIFNLVTYQWIRTLHTYDLQVSELSDYSVLTGSHLGILTTIRIPFEEESDSVTEKMSEDELNEGEEDVYDNEEEERVVSVWNLEQDCFVGNLMDSEYIARYRTEPYLNDLMKEHSASVEYEMTIIDDTHVLTSHEDHILRIWNVQTGKLVKRLYGHKSDTRIIIVDNSPYFLTYGEWQEENSLRLWDKQTFKCLASFTLDDSMVAVEWLRDGRSFITTTKSSQIIHWTIHNVGIKDALSTFPILFKNKVCDMT
ncbi:hypothetical protein KUTeg_009858 [Tegillarca granosa]|uniref:Uncharacterized protein n=1 Tax=Tegillarca granosa TaxID=220873 RepID=A0ABQ9F533_TEGGR|nr:hypothetical protein KUTeg_009858 [Tegillarca granosa]